MEGRSAVAATIFDKNYALHQKHLKLKVCNAFGNEPVLAALEEIGRNICRSCAKAQA